MTPPGDKNTEGLFLKWAVRFLFMLCMALISTVILSEPRIAGQVKAAASKIGDRFSAGQQVTADEPEETAPVPAVRDMPTDRVPVRRLIGD